MSKKMTTHHLALSEQDRRAERKYWFWMTVHGLLVGGVSLAILPTIALLTSLGLPEYQALIVAPASASLVCAVIALVAWLQTHRWLEWLYRTVRSRVLVGTERLARDDEDLMLEGISEVVFEWRHIDDILRNRDMSSILLGVGTLTLIIAALAGTFWVVAGKHSATFIINLSQSAIAASLIAPVLLLGISALALSWSVYHSRCFAENEYDPTAAIQDRIQSLLIEVKTLRRTGVMAR